MNQLLDAYVPLLRIVHNEEVVDFPIGRARACASYSSVGGLITGHAKRIAAALRPGGHLVVENYHADLNRKGITGDPLGYPVNALLEAFAPLLRIVQYEEFRDFPDWGNRGEKVPLVHMLARKG